MTMNGITSRTTINETCAMQIFCVIAWLWAVPVIDSLESYSYGTATRALITSFIPFVAGIIAAVSLPLSVTQKCAKVALGIGCVILALFLVFYIQLFNLSLGYLLVNFCGLFRAIGFLLIGYGLRSLNVFSKPVSFKAGVLASVGFYIIYNLLLWGTHNPHPDWMLAYHLSNIFLAIVRIAIVITLWKTLSADSVTRFFNRFPKMSLLVAGLFWGMILVFPADSYSSLPMKIVMFFAAPILAYVFTVIVRFVFFALSSLLREIFSNKFWWRKSCRWWGNDTQA